MLPLRGPQASASVARGKPRRQSTGLTHALFRLDGGVELVDPFNALNNRDRTGADSADWATNRRTTACSTDLSHLPGRTPSHGHRADAERALAVLVADAERALGLARNSSDYRFQSCLIAPFTASSTSGVISAMP